MMFLGMGHFNRRVLAATLCVAAGLAAPHAHAADSGSFSVLAAVAGTCVFTSVPPMSFTLDATSGSPGNATSVVQYKCTRGTAANTFTVGGVANGASGYTSGTTAATGGLAGTGGNTDILQFQVTWSSPAVFNGTGFGVASTAASVTLNGSIAYVQFANARPDTYTGSVPLVVSP